MVPQTLKSESILFNFVRVPCSTVGLFGHIYLIPGVYQCRPDRVFPTTDYTAFSPDVTSDLDPRPAIPPRQRRVVAGVSRWSSVVPSTMMTTSSCLDVTPRRPRVHMSCGYVSLESRSRSSSAHTSWSTLSQNTTGKAGSLLSSGRTLHLDSSTSSSHSLSMM